MLQAAHLPQTDDTAAIIAVLEEETHAYMAKDFDRWAACWLQADRTTSVTSGAQGLLVYQGWDAIATAFRQEMLDQPAPLVDVISEKRDYRITRDGDMAWVTYQTLCTAAGPIQFDDPNIFETRVVERVDGQWLISYMSVLCRRSGPEDPARVQVAAGGRIVWAALEAVAALKTHPHLTISHGHLRARRQGWDKVLQQAIADASAVMPYEHFNAMPDAKTTPMMIPVILGEDDSGAVQSCTVYPHDGTTYVTFDDGARVTRSIGMARMVFGLSEAQSRLCAAIAAGQNLTTAAETLGISLNTARTHLSRIYDKTGVHSQTALVRILLSVGIAQT